MSLSVVFLLEIGNNPIDDGWRQNVIHLGFRKVAWIADLRHQVVRIRNFFLHDVADADQKLAHILDRSALAFEGGISGDNYFVVVSWASSDKKGKSSTFSPDANV